MLYRQFKAHTVSIVGLGSGDFGGACPSSLAWEFLDYFAELGGNYIDTARVYGDFKTPRDGESENTIGRWMAARHNRDKIFLSTKGAHPRLNTMHIPRLSRGDILIDIQQSLDALGTDHVDIYWLHRDDVNRPVGEIMETLQELIESGHTVYTGVSNWTTGRIIAANQYAVEHGLTPLSANQPQFSLAYQHCVEDPTLVQMDPDMYRMHMDTQMICVPYSSQAKGFFSKLDKLGADSLPQGLKKGFLSPENLSVFERIRYVQNEIGLSVTAIALAWLTSQPFPVIPMVGASRIAHLKDLENAIDASLTHEQCRYLRSLI